MTAVNELSFIQELFEISSPTSDTLFYVTGESEYNDGVHIYLPAPIKRSSFTLSTDLSVPKVTVSAPPSAPLLRYLANYPVVPTTVVIKRIVNGSTITLFSGKVKTVVLQGSIAVAECSSGSNILEVNIPNKVCSAFCQNSLFDSDCGLSSSAYLVSASVTPYPQYLQSSVFSSYTSGWFTGGYVQTVSQDFRYILVHTGDKVYLQAPFPASDVTTGTIVSVFPGCDGVYSTCETKFNNLHPSTGKGFCGMPTIPTKNPVIWGFNGPKKPEGAVDLSGTWLEPVPPEWYEAG